MDNLTYHEYDEMSYQRTESLNHENPAARLYKLQGLRTMDLPFIMITLCLALSGCHSDVQGFCNQGGHFGIQTHFAFVTN